jgi:hypothetical protein
MDLRSRLCEATRRDVDDVASLDSFACREALALAANLDISKGVIASDCLDVIKNLPIYASVLREIFLPSENFVEIIFTYERRTWNAHVYDLALSSLDLIQRRPLWHLQSPDISIVPMIIEL